MGSVINLKMSDGGIKTFIVPPTPQFIKLFSGGKVHISKLSETQLRKIITAWRDDLLEAADICRKE